MQKLSFLWRVNFLPVSTTPGVRRNLKNKPIWDVLNMTRKWGENFKLSKTNQTIFITDQNNAKIIIFMTRQFFTRFDHPGL